MVEPHFFEGTATADSTTTLTDTTELVNYADDYLIGAFVYLYSATTNGDQERRITDNVQSTGVITVPTWSDPTGTVKYEVHRGVRVKDYNEAINHCIRSLADYGRSYTEKVADVSLTMTSDGTSTSYLYEIPAGFRYVSQILYESADASIYDFEVPPGAWKKTIELKTAATTSADSIWQLRLDRRYWEPIADRQLRILGGGEQAEVSTDTAAINENIVAYLTNYGAYWMISQGRHGLGPDAKSNTQRAGEYYRIASEARMAMKHFAPPGCVVLRQ